MAEFLNNLRGKFLGDQMVQKRSLSAAESCHELEYNQMLLADAEKNLREIFNNLLKGDETGPVIKINLFKVTRSYFAEGHLKLTRRVSKTFQYLLKNSTIHALHNTHFCTKLQSPISSI